MCLTTPSLKDKLKKGIKNVTLEDLKAIAVKTARKDIQVWKRFMKVGSKLVTPYQEMEWPGRRFRLY